MPNRAKHVQISKEILGESNPLIHYILDSSSLLVGSKHRKHTHNLHTVKWLEYMFGESGRREAMIHILADAGVIKFNEKSRDKKDTRTERGSIGH
jgi:hypothetical protein